MWAGAVAVKVPDRYLGTFLQHSLPLGRLPFVFLLLLLLIPLLRLLHGGLALLRCLLLGLLLRLHVCLLRCLLLRLVLHLHLGDVFLLRRSYHTSHNNPCRTVRMSIDPHSQGGCALYQFLPECSPRHCTG